jgi:hypothetical protein
MKAYEWLIEPAWIKESENEKIEKRVEKFDKNVWKATIECDAEFVNLIENLVQAYHEEGEEETEEE